jgi:hypothetical protein
MTYASNKKSEIILRKDKEWRLIENELCIVKDFRPLMGSVVKDGMAISPVTSVPYASVELKCKKIQGEITGFICHKIDFINLWYAFRENGLDGETEEVCIYWSTKHYNNIIVKILSSFQLIVLGATPFPKIIVIVYKKGTYERNIRSDNGILGQEHKLPLKENAEVFIYGSMPLQFWIPDIMKEKL